MNYMKQIADILGVELGEEFMIRFESGDITDDLYMITQAGICIPKLSTTVYDIFPKLLTGQIEIIKLPWKPMDGKAVWICVPGEGIVELDFNDSDLEHLALYKLGKLYRTREEAEAHAEEDKAYWDEVRKELEE